MNEIAVLIKRDYEGATLVETQREVFCGFRSIGMAEFYSANSTDYRPELKLVLADYLDYDGETDAPEDPKPVRISREGYDLRTMYKEDAIMELEISGKPFVLYRNARRNVLQIVYRLSPGEYSIIELGNELKA